jgi:predicted RNA-binding protein YlxR (DUF448 family)
MRARPDDPPDPDLREEGPARRCILTGGSHARETLIRLVEGPDGALWPDLAARLPGRGAWVLPDRPALEAALASGRLRAALARSFKTRPPTIPADLPERIADGLEARLLQRLGLEQRAGNLLAGAEKLETAARMGKLALLLHAGDAQPNGVARLEQALRVGGGEKPGIRLPIPRARLSKALGRDNMVHIGITDGRAAARVEQDLARLLAYTRPADDLNPAPGPSPAPEAHEGRE